MANKECTKCIHHPVCKTAESCDGRVPGCEHFKEQKKGRWIEDYETFVQDNGYESEPIHTGFVCSVCGRHSCSIEPYCHCGADMRGEEELIRALQYDREQYNKGYADAKAELVPCKDCKHFGGHGACHCHAADENGTPIFVRENDFCSYGERREGE